MNSSSRPASKRRFVLVLVILAIGLVGSAVILFSNRSSKLQDQFSWLTPAEFTQVKRAGPLTQLKYRVMNWTAPLWKSYWRNRPQISVNIRVLALPATIEWPTSPFQPFMTTTNGTRVWILSPAQLKSIETEFAALPETAVTARSQVVTTEGGAASVASGNSFGNGSIATVVGTSVFLVPTTAADKIVLPLDFNYTQFETNSISKAVSVKINQAYACRAIFPNDGGLLVENPNPGPGESNQCWLFLSAKAVDANGRLLGR